MAHSSTLRRADIPSAQYIAERILNYEENHTDNFGARPAINRADYGKHAAVHLQANGRDID